MSSHIGLRPFAAMRQMDQMRWCLLIVTALAVQGCAAAPTRPLVGPDAADPDVRVPPTVHHSTFGRSESARPIEPAPWPTPGGGTTQPKKDGS